MINYQGLMHLNNFAYYLHPGLIIIISHYEKYAICEIIINKLLVFIIFLYPW